MHACRPQRGERTERTPAALPPSLHSTMHAGQACTAGRALTPQHDGLGGADAGGAHGVAGGAVVGHGGRVPQLGQHGHTPAGQAGRLAAADHQVTGSLVHQVCVVSSVAVRKTLSPNKQSSKLAPRRLPCPPAPTEQQARQGVLVGCCASPVVDLCGGGVLISVHVVHLPGGRGRVRPVPGGTPVLPAPAVQPCNARPHNCIEGGQPGKGPRSGRRAVAGGMASPSLPWRERCPLTLSDSAMSFSASGSIQVVTFVGWGWKWIGREVSELASG